MKKKTKKRWSIPLKNIDVIPKLTMTSLQHSETVLCQALS